MAKIAYHQLPAEKKWLGSGGSCDSDCTIGGRDTDLSQIALALETLIKEHYEINGVPLKVVGKMDMLKGLLETGEERIQELIMLVAIGEED